MSHRICILVIKVTLVTENNYIPFQGGTSDGLQSENEFLVRIFVCWTAGKYFHVNILISICTIGPAFFNRLTDKAFIT